MLKMGFQESPITRGARREPEPQEKTLVWDIAAGSGKTRGWLHCANYAYRLGAIDAVVCFTPRLNLARQAELEWKDRRQDYADPVMGSILHRDNTLPFIAPGSAQFGYCSTF